MSDYNDKNEGAACCIAVLISLLTLLMVMCSCSTRTITQTEYKEVPITITDTLVQKVMTHDTTIVCDSVYIHQRGDTVYYTKFKDVYRTKWLHDTTTKVVEREVPVYLSKRETITKEVNRLRWSQVVLSLIGAFTLASVLTALIIKYRKQK